MSIAKSKSEILAVALIFALLPLLYIQTSHLWERPHFQFFPLAWGAVVWLAYSQGKLVPTQEHWRARTALTLAVIAVLMTLVAALRVSPWIAHAALILGVTAWGLQRLGEVPWSRWLAWTSLLWITLPLPLGLDTDLVQNLQSISSESAGALLDLMGTPFLREGNLIEVKEKRLFVDEACSGVDSLYSLAAVALFIVIFQKRPFIVSIFSIALVPAWAWFGNVLRLSLIAWLLDFANNDLSSGWKHSILGIVIFGVVSACLYATIEAISSLLYRFSPGGLPRENKQVHLAYNVISCWPGTPPKVRSEEDQYFGDARSKSASEQRQKSFSRNPNSVGSPYLPMAWQMGVAILSSLCAFGVSVWNIGNYSPFDFTMHLPHYPATVVNQFCQATSLPAQFDDAHRTRFQEETRSIFNTLGEHSRIWIYDKSGTPITISLDFPFRGYHHLLDCYLAGGSSIRSEPKCINTQSRDSQNTVSIVTAELSDSMGSQSYLCYSLFTKSGTSIDITPQQAKTVSSDSLSDRLQRRTASADLESVPVTFQFQMLVQNGDQLSEQEKQHYLDIYLEALPYAIEQVKKLNAASEK